MHVLKAQHYAQILFRLVVSPMVLRVETENENEVLKEERRVESAESCMN